MLQCIKILTTSSSERFLTANFTLLYMSILSGFIATFALIQENPTAFASFSYKIANFAP